MGRDEKYPAPIAFTLAHEIGHIMLGHLANSPAIVDLADPGGGADGDLQEAEANEFALELLTGSPEPIIQTSKEDFSARTLAASVAEAGPRYKIEPGTLALCTGYQTQNWSAAMGSLGYIYGEERPYWEMINKIASRQLSWDSMSSDSAEYVSNVMNIENVK
jgi:hypothetical protein